MLLKHSGTWYTAAIRKTLGMRDKKNVQQTHFYETTRLVVLNRHDRGHNIECFGRIGIRSIDGYFGMTGVTEINRGILEGMERKAVGGVIKPTLKTLPDENTTSCRAVLESYVFRLPITMGRNPKIPQERVRAPSPNHPM